MISYLEGTIRDASPGLLTLMVHSIGFTVSIPRTYHIMPGEQIKLEIYFLWPSEQVPQLYGFKTRPERDLFSLIIGCSGFGPKIGLAVLSTFSVGQAARILQSQDIRSLSTVEGIGVKKAEQLCLYLREKVVHLRDEKESDVMHQISQALQSLGYSSHEIRTVMLQLNQQSVADMNFAALMKKSLALLQ